MDAQEVFIAYLQDHPAYYSIAKSDVYITVLSLLEKEASDLEMLQKKLPEVEFADIVLIVRSLESLKFVQAVEAEKTVYLLTDAARDFLSMYRKTKSSFGTM